MASLDPVVLGVRARACGVPDHMVYGLVDYIVNHREQGSFLMAVLTNNLKESFARSDATNRPRIGAFVDFLYNWAPFGCWGSEERVNDWLAEEPEP